MLVNWEKISYSALTAGAGWDFFFAGSFAGRSSMNAV
jgi:hypothetical protein